MATLQTPLLTNSAGKLLKFAVAVAAVCRGIPGHRVDLFRLGSANDLQHNWAGFKSLGGALTTPPTAVSTTDEYGFAVDVFGTGPDKAAWHGRNEDGIWLNWESLGGTYTSRLDVTARDSPHLDIFGLGKSLEGTQQSWVEREGQWSGQKTINGTFALPITSVSSSSNTLDAFGVGPDIGLYQNAWNGSKWSGWQYVIIPLSSPVATVLSNKDRIDLVCRSQYYYAYNTWNGNEWGEWSALSYSNHRFDSEPSLVSWGPGRMDLFGVGSDVVLYHLYYDNGTWTREYDNLGGSFASAPTAISCQENRLDVFAVGVDGAVWLKSWDGSTWVEWKSLG
ncbi:hypothetical protein VTL71DRAFT_11512 [Oculimacula yallundae]|uniref:PLL-like beta propeller domain-containing protein n=1 Tax=Oculimacula yallundae TaxID=86028 RepID=A0ABR4CSX5_9HELO